jgi:hypothetical protein
MATRVGLLFFAAVVTASFPAVAQPPLAQPPPAQPPPVEAEGETVPPEAEDELADRMDFWSHFVITGYVQGELRIRSQENEAGPNDNADLFAVRRGIVRIKFTYELAELQMEVSATPSGVAVRDAEATLVIPWTEEIQTRVTAGLFRNPWGIDVRMSPRERAFPEPAMLAGAFFPGERDVGVRLSGGLGDVLEYAVAVVNGQPIGAPPITIAPGSQVAFDVGEDPNDAKDVVGRLGLALGPLALGVSGIWGTGFAPPIPDDPGTLVIDETQAAFDFTRWGAGIDVRFRQDVGNLGKLDVYGELTLAGNLDRSIVPANASADAVPHLGWYVAAVQTFGDHFGGAVRFEQYDRNTDVGTDTRGGLALTVAALLFPVDHARVTLAMQHTIPESGDPSQDYWLRLQVDF